MQETKEMTFQEDRMVVARKNENEGEQRGFLDRNTIKYIVVIAMFMDHIGSCFSGHMPVLGEDILHLFGRIVAPVMAFFIAEGFLHTSDLTRYRRRVGLFALLSWLPCIFLFLGFEAVKENPFLLIAQSVLASFYLALVALGAWYSDKFNKITKILIVVGLCLLSLVTDMAITGILAPLFHCVFREDRVKRYITVSLSYVAIVVPMLMTKGWSTVGLLFAPLLLIFCYNGQAGKKSAFHKWFFYIIFPVHLIILGIIRWYVLE